MSVDGRGSEPQRVLFDFAKELYPHLDIIYEYPIGDLGQRIDIFIPSIGLAIE